MQVFFYFNKKYGLYKWRVTLFKLWAVNKFKEETETAWIKGAWKAQTFSEFWSARARASFFSSETFFRHCWQNPPFSSDSEMETDPAPSGGGRLLHCASSTEWSLLLGVTGDSPLGHPSTFSTKCNTLVNFLVARKSSSSQFQCSQICLGNRLFAPWLRVWI